jgi:D-serine deaminase-like pyridoxal phosphate-dependent protein
VTRADIPTPALLVDVAAMDRNIRTMAAFFAGGSCRLRPHFKAHKTPEIARRQLAAGSCVGLTCATVSEAEVVAAFCNDILIANEVIGQDKCQRVASLASGANLAASGADLYGPRHITVAIDSVAGLEQIAAAIADHKGPRRTGDGPGRTGDGPRRAQESPRRVDVGVLIDVNVGQNRCGVAPGDEALTLARKVASTPGLRLGGVMGYEGHLQPLPERAERERKTRAAMTDLVSTARLLADAGLPCDIVSGGGTGTYDISGRVTGVTEIQAGSYVLMDTDYARLDLPFEHAFSVLGTIVSRPAADYCVADCGHKSTTKDHGMPSVKGIPGATVTMLNDEHAVIALPTGNPLRIGDRIELWPSHTDPTVNLHDVFYAVENDQVVGVWPIAARGYGPYRNT